MTAEQILCTSEGKMRIVRTPILQLLAKKSITRCDTLVDTSTWSKNLRAQKGRRNQYSGFPGLFRHEQFNAF